MSRSIGSSQPGRPLAAIHGFLGSPGDWDAFEKSLATCTHGASTGVVRVDLLDAARGIVAREGQHAIIGLDELAREIRRSLRSNPRTRDGYDIVGYSLGGRVALAMASIAPQPGERIVLVSTDPGLEGSAERAARTTRDAMHSHELTTVARAHAGERESLARTFLDKWYEQPLFDALRSRDAFGGFIRERAAALARGDAAAMWGRVVAGCSPGTAPSRWDALLAIRDQVVFIVGSKDRKYCELESRAHASGLASAVIPQCGHAVHIEQPSQLAQLVTRSMHTHTPTSPSVNWIAAGEFQDIRYELAEGIAKITICRPEVRNAFRPQTVESMRSALRLARYDASVGVIILTGEGPLAFCSGGDMRIRHEAGYADADGTQSLNVLDLQREIRTCPKPVIAMVAGYAIGGGHVLHMVCDLTIAAENAVFGQTGPKVGSFDGGFGASYMARIVGQKKAREIWFLCRQYDAAAALEMGLINRVVPLEQLESETVQWAREILSKSPLAIRCLKAALNADCDGQAGLQELAGNATLLYYMTAEGQEGHHAYLEKRSPDFGSFTRRP